MERKRVLSFSEGVEDFLRASTRAPFPSVSLWI